MNNFKSGADPSAANRYTKSDSATAHADRRRVQPSVYVIGAWLLVARTAGSQPIVPIVNLPAATARTSTTLGAILGLKQVAGGKVLVNDAGRHQIKLFDSTLATFVIASDSAPGQRNSYGQYATPLISYLGDSSLFTDLASRSVLLLDGTGEVRRVLSPPGGPELFTSFFGTAYGVDTKGRLVFKHSPGIMFMTRPSPSGPSTFTVTQTYDTLRLLRADLDTRRIDTVGHVLESDNRIVAAKMPDGRNALKEFVNPLPTFDEWALLSDGTVAVIRGHDYHIDWVHPDGTKSSTAKLPFDWKRLTDDEKQKVADSARAAHSAVAARRALAEAEAAKSQGGDAAGVAVRSGRGGEGSGGAGRPRGPGQLFDIVPLNEISDYYPPIRRGAAMPDFDGNVWILPTTSAQSQKGEMVYDVVNPKSGLFKRVRVPLGRSVAGFAKGGIVYLMTGDKTDGFHLERTKLP